MLINKETFEELPLEAKLGAIYDSQIATNEQLRTIDQQLSRKRKIDTIAAGIGGIIGGMITVIGKGIFFNGK